MRPLIDGVKVCNRCSESKSIKDFHPNKTCRLGVVGTCRDCTAEGKRKWYANNRKDRQSAANQRNQERKREMVEYFGGVCHDCQGKFPDCVYAFHHLDPSDKEMNPSKAINMKREKMLKEMNKCVMLCANCHMIRHHT